MATEEERAKEAYKAAGVDLPDLEKAPEEETPDKKEEPAEEKKAPEAPAEEPKDEPTDDLQNPKEPEKKKRSVYDDLKDKKVALKSEREAREQAERERDEFRAKLEALSAAKTPEEKKEAKDELEAYAEEIGADPAALKKLRELILKDVSAPKIDENITKTLEKVSTFMSQHEKELEQKLFEEEFTKVTPTLKEYFPGASDAEMANVKKELDRISHTKEWHDKDLEYIAWKNRETLSALVSPKKRGMESKGRKDVEDVSTDFDPEADLTKMTPKQREEWEKSYREATKSEGLTTDAQGRRIFI